MRVVLFGFNLGCGIIVTGLKRECELAKADAAVCVYNVSCNLYSTFELYIFCG